MKFAFLINYGTEIRPFIVSGLINNLINKNDKIVIITKRKISEKYFSDLEGIQQILLLENKNKFYRKFFDKTSNIFNYMLDLRMQNFNFKNFHFSKGVIEKRGFFDFFLRMPFVYNLFKSFLDMIDFFRQDYLKYDKILNDIGIDNLIYSSFNNNQAHQVLLWSKKNKVKTTYILSNWKDVYMQHFFRIIPNKMFYWSQHLIDDALLLNPKTNKLNVFNSGNLFFYSLLSRKENNGFSEIYNKYNISSNDKIILWPLSQLTMIDNELEVVTRISNFLKTMFKFSPIILLRENPLNSNRDLKKYFEEYDNIRICDDFWIKDYKSDFVFLSSQGENEWKSMLNISDLIVSTPSTVVLEASIFYKKTINFVFNANNQLINSLDEFVKSKFYNNLISDKFCYVSCNFDELEKLIFNCINNIEFLNNNLPLIIDGNLNSNFNDVINNIKE
jgi:hypothetical protein